MERKKKIIISIVVIAVVASISVIPLYFMTTQKVILKVFHAGSLAKPFESVEAEFEADYPFIDVQLESAGSVQCVSKITETGKIADVLAVADWKLIPKMDSQYQDYCIKFAVNRMVLCYTSLSTYKDEIKKENFFNYLKKTDVSWGFSNPNLDPCGYRSLMVLQLCEFAYGDTQIIEDLITSKSAITVVEAGGVYNITTPEDLAVESSAFTIRDKSVDLVTLLNEGGLDYAFEYQSVAEQHNLEYIQLDPTVDLSDANYDSTYANVKIVKTTGVSTGKSITYGITVPLNANLAAYGALFIEYVINGTGKEIFTTMGQPPLTPCIVDNLTAMRFNLRPHCIEE